MDEQQLLFSDLFKIFHASMIKFSNRNQFYPRLCVLNQSPDSQPRKALAFWVSFPKVDGLRTEKETFVSRIAIECANQPYIPRAAFLLGRGEFFAQDINLFIVNGINMRGKSATLSFRVNSFDGETLSSPGFRTSPLDQDPALLTLFQETFLGVLR